MIATLACLIQGVKQGDGEAYFGIKTGLGQNAHHGCFLEAKAAS